MDDGIAILHRKKVRKYLESIRQFVFEVDMFLNEHRRMSPLTNWRRMLFLVQHREYVMPIRDEIPRPLRPSDSHYDAHCVFPTKFIPKGQRTAFGRKRRIAQHQLQRDLIGAATERIDDLVDDVVADALDESVQSAAESVNEPMCLSSAQSADGIDAENVDFHFAFGLNHSDISIPSLLRTMDAVQFGPSLFVECVRSLQTKDRRGLWVVLQFICSRLPAPSALSLLNRHQNELLRFPKEKLNKLCLKTIECAPSPIATALFLSGFMASCSEMSGSAECRDFAALYTDIAIDLCSDIESDHLLAILLEIPSLFALSILDIAIKHKLSDFLYSDRLRPLLNRMWTDFAYLDPSTRFAMKPPSALSLFDGLRCSPSAFYYSPRGLFAVNVFFYIFYVLTFTRWLMEQQYPFHSPLTTTESVLWLFSAGHAVQEVMALFYRRKLYPSSVWDFCIVLNWTVIAVIRWPMTSLLSASYFVFDSAGNLDEAAMRNQPLTVVFMVAVAIQSVLIWTRSMMLLQRSKRTGRLIQTIFVMLSEVWTFCIVLTLFVIGSTFALYYLVGGDIYDDDDDDQGASRCDFGAIDSVLLFMVQALLGQHDWDLLKSSSDTAFGVERSRTAEALVVLFSIIGNVALLNLLIALMAAVYEENAPSSAKQVHFAAILNTVELMEKEAVLPPPFNLAVIAGMTLFFAVENALYFVSCSRWSLNVTRMGATDYALNRNWIRLESTEMDSLRADDRAQSKGDHSLYTAMTAKGDGSDSDSDDAVPRDGDGETERKYDSNDYGFVDREEASAGGLSLKYKEQREIVRRNGVFWEKEDFSSMNSKKMYCRFCRNRVRVNGDIAVYFALCRHYKAVDESDQRLLVHSLRGQRVCPFCFRPIPWRRETTRCQVTMEIISFWVFMIVGYLPIVIALAIPAAFSWIGSRFNLWTTSNGNHSGNDEQLQLRADNVIFGGMDPNRDDEQYQNLSTTIKGEYHRFLQRGRSEGDPVQFASSPNQKRRCFDRNGNGEGGNPSKECRKVVDGQNELIDSIAVRPIESRMSSQRRDINNRSAVMDSSLYQTVHSDNEMMNEIVFRLKEIQKEVNALKRRCSGNREDVENVQSSENGGDSDNLISSRPNRSLHSMRKQRKNGGQHLHSRNTVRLDAIIDEMSVESIVTQTTAGGTAK